MAQLILENVFKRFGAEAQAPAVSGFSLHVEAGTFLALLGPSGCGKTTILRMLAGFETPTAGTIRLGDRVLAGEGQKTVPPEARNMAMVFQSYALWPHMSVGDNIGYPLKVRGIRGEAYRQKVAEALKTVHMNDFGPRRPNELSGGQRQRVALARCLVSDPDVVLLDEPLANLDRHLRAEMEETFREFHARTGATMVYVTHDQAEAMALADQIAVMSAGKLLQVGPPADIYRRPNVRAVADLIGQGAILTLPVAASGAGEVDEKTIANALTGPANAGLGAEIFVRPEDVVLDPEGPLEAVVASAVFKGERYALTLAGKTGLSLLAYSGQPLELGDSLRCRITRGWRL